MKSIGILGSTGSIGTQTLDVIDALPGKFYIKYLTSNQNTELLGEQALKYKPDTVCIANEEKRDDLEIILAGTNINITSGRNALLEAAGRNDVNLVMNGLVGAIGMEPTIESVKAGVDVALSNKESMVILLPISQLGCCKASSRVIRLNSSLGFVRNGPPEPVKMMHFT